MNILESLKVARSITYPSQRTGSAALMLILVLTLLVGTFTITFTSRISHERQIRWDDRSIATLESAIQSVADSGITADSDNTKIRLPIDEDSDQWVIVEIISDENETPFFQATIYRAGERGIFVRRPL